MDPTRALADAVALVTGQALEFELGHIRPRLNCRSLHGHIDVFGLSLECKRARPNLAHSVVVHRAGKIRAQAIAQCVMPISNNRIAISLPKAVKGCARRGE